jgi:predicted alpha/beta-hydrolase family hydrolase
MVADPTTGTLTVDAKLAVPWQLDLPPSTVPDSSTRAALVFTHGASGDLSTGQLPAYAAAAAAVGFPCVRMTCKSSSVATRARAIQVRGVEPGRFDRLWSARQAQAAPCSVHQGHQLLSCAKSASSRVPAP